MSFNGKWNFATNDTLDYTCDSNVKIRYGCKNSNSKDTQCNIRYSTRLCIDIKNKHQKQTWRDSR